MPLSHMVEAYHRKAGATPSQDGDMDRLLWLISGIEVTAEKPIEEFLLELDSKKKKFTLRGRARRQLRDLMDARKLRLGRRVIYASHPKPTHRVLVYAFYGTMLREYSLDDPMGCLMTVSVYDDKGYSIVPLARIDVRVPLKWLASQYGNSLEQYRWAVERKAEAIAFKWYRRWATHLGYNPLSQAASGWTASVIGPLTPRMKRRQRIWKDAKPIRTYPRAILNDGVARQTPNPNYVFGSSHAEDKFNHHGR